MADPACLLSNGGAVLTGRRIVEFPEKTTFEATDSIPGVAEVPGGLADVRFDGATLLAAAEAAGEAGAAGIAKGADGATLLPTSGAPAAALGKNGDYAFDTAASVIYGPKAAGVWPAGVSFKGGKGDTGDVTPAVTALVGTATDAATTATTQAGLASGYASAARTAVRPYTPITTDYTAVPNDRGYTLYFHNATAKLFTWPTLTGSWADGDALFLRNAPTAASGTVSYAGLVKGGVSHPSDYNTLPPGQECLGIVTPDVDGVNGGARFWAIIGGAP